MYMFAHISYAITSKSVDVYVCMCFLHIFIIFFTQQDNHHLESPSQTALPWFKEPLLEWCGQRQEKSNFFLVIPAPKLRHFGLKQVPKTSLNQAGQPCWQQTLSDATPPLGKIHPFLKIGKLGTCIACISICATPNRFINTFLIPFHTFCILITFSYFILPILTFPYFA